MKQTKRTLRHHRPFLGLLLLYLVVAITFSIITPLGEAPDEPAHFSYAQFIATNGRLPATLAERSAAGYRSSWPPLYHLLVAGPIAAVGDQPPTRLKAIGDSPRRLIPTNGQTIASYIHTDDEGWPWRGITLAWHLARLMSILFSALAVTVTYLIAWKLTQKRWLATGVAAVQAFLPQFLFMGTVVTDDTLLILLGGLILMTLVLLGQMAGWPRFWHFGSLGVLLGLATITKYNALPLWAIAIGWSFWRAFTASNEGLSWRARSVRLAGALVWIGLGAVLTAGWWFWFVWLNFNQVETAGWIRGSLAALSAGTADATLRQLSAGTGLDIPPPAAWFGWYVMLFKSFWGTFGGGSTIEFAGWVYGLLLAITLCALLGLVRYRRFAPLLLIPLAFLPLPMLRFALSGSIVETAQGRHLFPSLAAIAFVLMCGLAGFEQLVTRSSKQARSKSRRGLLAAILLLLSLSALVRIQSSYPPYIPLRTTADPDVASSSLRAELAPGVVLTAIEIGERQNNTLLVRLVWQAAEIPAGDYLIQLTVNDIDGQTMGGWVGHPIGGRYPTRAWDPGDILTDTIPVPLASGAAGEFDVRVSLLDQVGMPLDNNYAERTVVLDKTGENRPIMPSELRADGLAASSPFSYRSTISLGFSEMTSPPVLTSPGGDIINPDWFNPVGFAHFIVKADWPSGEYQLSGGQQVSPVPVSNRSRQFEQPEMQNTVYANFADHITLLGYDLPQKKVSPGESLPITLHLRANQTMAENLAIFNHLLDTDTVQRGGVDRIPQLYYSTLLWVPGEVVSDNYLVPVDADAPPGIYWLDTGFYPTSRPDLSLPLMVEGQPIDRNSVAIGPIKVGGPPQGVTVSEASPETILSTKFGDEITLLGFDWEPGHGEQELAEHSNEITNLTLYWEANTSPQTDYTVFVHLLNSAGQLAGQADGPPAAGAYPTSLWESGEIIIDRHQLPGGLDFESVNVGLYRPDTGQRLSAEGFPDGAVPLSN